MNETIDTRKVVNLIDSINRIHSNELENVIKTLENITTDEFILLKTMLKAELKTNKKKSEIKDLKSTDEESFDEIISKHLKKLGVSTNFLGYGYIKTIVRIYIDEGELAKFTKKLYPETAKIHNTTSSKVERAIRYAIEVVWSKRENADMLEEYFGNTINPKKGKPTNSEFISGLATYLKMFEKI